MSDSLFHSFPRPASRGERDIQGGIRTLRSFFEIGLVLTPEVVALTEQLQDGSPGRTMEMGQKRICFTSIDESMIHSHAEVFGPISLEFDLPRLNAAGATPVFYVPPTTVPNGVSGVAGALIMQLGDVGNLLEELAGIKDLILGRAGNEVCTLTWGEPHGPQTSADISVSAMSAVVSYLEHRHGNARSMKHNLSALGQLFYPTHDPKRDLLAYYRQREWRIIGGLMYNGAPLSRELLPQEKDRLLSCNERFFGKRVKLIAGECVRVDECRVYTPPGVPRAMDLVKRIICPQECIDTIRSTVAEYGADVPVSALESLPAGMEPQEH